MPTAPVVCAGVVVADHICTPIDHLPAAGELVKADALELHIGGGACNAAVDLAKLGLPPRIIGRVGDDAFGRFVAETLAGHGVDTAGLRVDPRHATSQTLIVNVRGQDRRFIHSFGANEGFTVADLEAALDPAPKVLFLGYLFILANLDAADLAAVLRKARDRGVITIVDVATPGPGNYRPYVETVLPHTDVFLPNTDEAALILGEHDPVKQADAFRAMGAKRVVVTLGDRGAVSVSDDLRVRLGTFPTTYVDGSGGGDAFDAGYIAGLVEGRDELGCLTLASALGASCVRAIGTTAGTFTRPELDAFLASHTLPVERLG
jgi:sugar/nucleoside kinase (ribokinase family)